MKANTLKRVAVAIGAATLVLPANSFTEVEQVWNQMETDNVDELMSELAYMNAALIEDEIAGEIDLFGEDQA